ncbi:MAG: hypothetical protein VKJ24_07320 [Synechococcales bacterium]|nr:hypothetical protein [Synechococcales bacterium]
MHPVLGLNASSRGDLQAIATLAIVIKILGKSMAATWENANS